MSPVVSLNALGVTPATSATCCCCVKTEIRAFVFSAVSIWVSLDLSSPLSLCLPSHVCLLYESEPVPVWMLPCESVTVPVPTKGSAVSFIEQHRKHPMGKEWGRFHRILNIALQRIDSLTPSDLDGKQYNKHHCLSSNIHLLQPSLTGNIIFYKVVLSQWWS